MESGLCIFGRNPVPHTFHSRAPVITFRGVDRDQQLQMYGFQVRNTYNSVVSIEVDALPYTTKEEDDRNR